MSDGNFTIAIVGLGLIGGSTALALKGFKNCTRLGIDIREDVCKAAMEQDAVDFASTDPSQIIPKADLIIICIYPDPMIAFINDNIKHFKKNVIITDVGGIKEVIVSKIESLLTDDMEFVGGHPMAGREFDGFESADVNLFQGAGFLITPTKKSTPSSVALIHEIAEYIGCKRIEEISPKKHDEIIAYTSHLMHVSAAALCMTPPSDMTLTFTAGAFRDCTRIANINGKLWSELFIENKEPVLNEISKFISNIELLKKYIEEEDYISLKATLDNVRVIKEELLRR